MLIFRETKQLHDGYRGLGVEHPSGVRRGRAWPARHALRALRTLPSSADPDWVGGHREDLPGRRRRVAFRGDFGMLSSPGARACGQAPSRDAAAWRPGQAARGNTTTRTAVTSSAVANLAILSTGPDKRLGSPTVTVNAARRDGELYAISSVTLQTDGGRRNGTHTRGSGGRRHSLRLVTVISDLYITTKYEGFEIEPNRPQPNTKTTVTVEPSGAISGFHGPRIRLLWNRSGGGLEESWSCPY